MPNKKFNKKPQPVAEVSNPIFNATTLNDFTNLQLFLQQQSQILALNEAASSSIDYNNPVAILLIMQLQLQFHLHQLGMATVGHGRSSVGHNRSRTFDRPTDRLTDHLTDHLTDLTTDHFRNIFG
ncbi:unnamed protein product [Rhizophagus irregularis]|nr:unnamed protein product [Rhizophagus irregularis]